MSRRTGRGRPVRAGAPSRARVDPARPDRSPAESDSRRHHPSHAELTLLVEDAEWRGPADGQDPSDVRPDVDLQPFRSGWGAAGAPLAVARVRSTRLRARRIHRSFVIEIERGENEPRVTTVFCPPDPETTPAVEFATERLVDSLDLPANSVVRLVGTLAEPAPRHATRARLVHRDIESSWVVARGRWGGRFPEVDDLELLPTDGHGADPVTEVLHPDLAAPLYRLLSSVLPVPAAVSVARRHDIRELWEGEGRAEVVTVLGGGDELPEATDPVDLAVDRHGHVILGEVGWACPVCHSAGCWECPTDELLAACTSCRQEACGRCRTGGHAPPTSSAACSFCGARSCGDCGRREGVSPCVVCGTESCARCREDGLCHRCSHLHPADSHEIDQLPLGLHALGLDVSVGRHRDTVIAAMSGAERREVALVRRDEIAEWWTIADGSTPGGWLSAPYRATGDGNAVVEWRPVDDTAPAGEGRPHLVVSRDERAVVTWTCEDTEGSVVVRGTAAVPVADLHDERAVHAALAASGVAGSVRRPVRPPRRLATVLERLVPERAEVPVRHRIRVARHSEAARTEILGGGLRGFSTESGTPEVHVAPWRSPHADDANLFPGWSPAPEILCAAGLDEASASLARFGSLVVMAVARRGQPVRFHPLTETTGVLESIELGESLLGGSVPAVVASTVDPTSVDELDILDATRVERVVRPLLLEPDGPPSRAATTMAVRSWPGADAPMMAGTEPVPPDDVADALFATAQSFGKIPEPHVVSVGVEVIETWHTGTGPITLRRRFRPARYVSTSAPELAAAPVVADPVALEPPG